MDAGESTHSANSGPVGRAESLPGQHGRQECAAADQNSISRVCACSLGGIAACALADRGRARRGCTVSQWVLKLSIQIQKGSHRSWAVPQRQAMRWAERCVEPASWCQGCLFRFGNPARGAGLCHFSKQCGVQEKAWGLRAADAQAACLGKFKTASNGRRVVPLRYLKHAGSELEASSASAIAAPWSRALRWALPFFCPLFYVTAVVKKTYQVEPKLPQFWTTPGPLSV
eukprot:1159641-Pelagomonas_calceolata.AAC.5